MAPEGVVVVKLESRIPQVSPKIAELAGQVVRKTAFDLQARAQQIVPVDTGFLKGSITTTQTGPLSATVGTNAEYAAYVELGTTTQTPQPYLGPAAEAVRPGFEAAFQAIDKLR